MAGSKTKRAARAGVAKTAKVRAKKAAAKKSTKPLGAKPKATGVAKKREATSETKKTKRAATEAKKPKPTTEAKKPKATPKRSATKKTAKAHVVSSSPARVLPAALAKRAEAEVAAKQGRLAKDARADIDLILRRRERIAEDFWDIGEALVRLKRPGIAAALGRASFREICEKDLTMSLTAAEALVTIVTGVAREDALRMGQERALALVTLAKATPEPDSAATLQKGRRKLPSGKVIDLEKATTRELYAAAKELRGAGGDGARPRGRTTTAAERERASALQAALVAADLPRARVSAVATKPGQEADIKIEGVPIGALLKLRAALSKHA